MSAAISGAGATVATPVNRFAELSTDDFLRVMLSELQNQDPFAPQDSTALMEQLSSLRNIESQLSLQANLETLVLQNQIAAAGGLIDKLVVGLDESNDEVQGLVMSVSIRDGKAYLELDSGATLRADRVTQIHNLELTEGGE